MRDVVCKEILDLITEVTEVAVLAKFARLLRPYYRPMHH
jgi:hypothetical protein